MFRRRLGDKAMLEKVQKRMEDRAVGMALEQLLEHEAPVHPEKMIRPA